MLREILVKIFVLITSLYTCNESEVEVYTAWIQEWGNATFWESDRAVIESQYGAKLGNIKVTDSADDDVILSKSLKTLVGLTVRRILKA